METDARGTLRVYLGAAPGVGKTYAMLDEGCRRADRGTDVVVGIVETHGRRHTNERIGGLEVLPRRTVRHRGTEHTELDLPGVLARHPDVVLVDELAHTNPDGLEHTKRWQDVEEILAAGIDVVTTVNVQHLASLGDVVEAITGVRQRETVPDVFVRSADAIELVDMSPQALRRRMAHGNVYPPERVDAALSKFFREGNLTALRELALLWVADRVDEGLSRYRDEHEIDATWAARERIVVAVTGGPESEVLMRRAARIAGRSAAGEWLAVYVARGDGLVGVDPHRLASLHTVATDLGGSLHTVVGDDTPSAILAFARAAHATQVLIGASRRSRLSTLARPGIGEEVIAASGDVDVHIVTHDEARRKSGPTRRPPRLGRRRRLAGFALALAGPPLLTALLLATPDLHGLPSESMLLMTLVVATALVGGLSPAIVGALASAFVLNYYFTPPLRTVTIASGDNAVAIVLFVLVGIAVASVVDLAARRTVQAARASAEADALSALSFSLLHAGDIGRLLEGARDLFGMRSAALVSADGQVVAAVGDLVAEAETDVDTPVGESHRLLLTGRTLAAGDQRLVAAYAAHASVLLERRRAAAERAEQRALAETDRTRTALLAAVSHDLRSPLAAVKAAVSSLRDPSIVWSDDDERELLATIDEGADRLDGLVANLLDMSRVHMGAVRARTETVELAATLERAVGGLPGHERVVADLAAAEDVLADAGLLERVLANVVGNALTHGGGEVRVDAARDGDRVVVRVADTGRGVAVADLSRLFEPFQRLGDVPAGEGIGLGLAVARGLTEAMGGTVTAEQTPGGGLTVVLVLPVADGATP